MADSKSGDGLPDVQEKEDGKRLVVQETSEKGASWQEVEKLKEQLSVHVETIGFLVTEKAELESALAESQKINESKQATVEELQKRLDGFSRCVSDSDGRCACTADLPTQQEVQRLEGIVSELNGKLEFADLQLNKQLETCRQCVSEKDSQMTKHREIVQELQNRLQTQDTTLSGLKSRLDHATEEKQQFEEEVRRQSEQLNSLKDERESLRREQVLLVEQQAKSQEDVSNILKVEKETLQRENAQRVEELVSKLKLLEESLRVLQNEKESLVWENTQTMEQLQQRDLSVGECVQQIEQLQNQRKQLESQVSSLLNEKDQLLGRCDELQSLLEDLRLRYAVANEELSQSNEATQMVTDAFNKLQAQLDQVNRIAEVHAAENQELSRKLEEKAGSVRKLEATMQRSNSTKTEHGQHLENRKTMLNGNSDNPGNPSIDDDSFERYSNDVLEHLRQNAPLIERLQKELNSAQDTINALTNQNSELKSRTKSESNGNLNEADALQSLSRLEMERNRLKEELEQLRRQHRSLEEKMELAEEDLARQVPATVNGDVIVQAQFEALQSVMKRLEAKYTQVMRDKAELMDTTERLEHIITQLQDESNTIGEYVSLYHHQRFVLRQRTAEKDGYIYQLANERSALQSQLAQLQVLIMQLLNERHVADASSHEIGQEVTSAGRSSPVSLGDDVGQPVDMNGVREKDDLNSREKLPNTNHSVEPVCTSCQHESALQLPDQPSSHPPSNIPEGKQTALKIMHLLKEIGTSQLVDGRRFEERNYVRCNHCSGKILIA